MLAFSEGFAAAFNGAELTSCPYSVHKQTREAAQWIKGYLDCTLNIDSDFESAFEKVVEVQLADIDDPEDQAKPFIKRVGLPGSEQRIEAYKTHYESQVIAHDGNNCPVYAVDAESAFV